MKTLLATFVNTIQAFLWGYMLFIIWEKLPISYLELVGVVILVMAVLYLIWQVKTDKSPGRETAEVFLAFLVIAYVFLNDARPEIFQHSVITINHVAITAALLGININAGHIVGVLLIILAKVLTFLAGITIKISGQELPKVPVVSRKRTDDVEKFSLKMATAERHGS